MVSEEQANQARKVAEELMTALNLMTCFEFIICEVVDNGKEMTKGQLSLLRDYVPNARDALNEVVTAFVAGKIAEME